MSHAQVKSPPQQCFVIDSCHLIRNDSVISLLKISDAGMITAVALIILFIFVIATIAVIVVVKKKNCFPKTLATSNKKTPSDNKKKPAQEQGSFKTITKLTLLHDFLT